MLFWKIAKRFGRDIGSRWAGLVFIALIVLGTDAASAAITLSPSSLHGGAVGNGYSQDINANGGTGPYTFSVTSGSLPAGLTLAPNTGTISGTPTTTGVNNFTITATDATSATGSRAYSIAVGNASLTLSPTSLPSGNLGSAYSQTISASGGIAPYNFVISSGSLPPGLSLDFNSGVLSGTPTALGSYGFIVQATDINGNSGFRTYTVAINGVTLTVNPATLPNGTQGVGYSQTVSASGGSGPYSFSVISGTLPAGLTLNTNTGIISGTPSGSGSSSFTIEADDSVGNFGTRSYTVSISVPLTVNPGGLPNGTWGTAYSQTVSASGGTGPDTFAVTVGALPAGLSLNASTGVISGTPTGNGASNFTIQATDSVGNTGSRAYTVTINTVPLTVNPSSLPAGTQNVAYSQTVSATGGAGPYTFAVTAGALPTGLSLNASTGVISGTPTGSGASNFTVQATDSVGNIGSRAYTVTNNAAPLTINPANLPAATLGTPYNQTVTASGGSAPYNYIVLSGSLPPGLSLGAGTGVISGTPTTVGSYNFTIQATDAAPNTGTRNYTVNVGSNILTVSPGSLPNGTQGAPYSQTVSASGGTGPYAFVLASGSLPVGLSISAGGVISGTPSGSGPSTFTVRATDSVGNIGTSASYTVNIGTNTLTISPPSLPNGTQGAAYSQTVTAGSGTGPYTFVLAFGSLPTGLTISSGGVISGTPTGSGASTFTVRATDSVGNIGTSASYTVNIGTAVLTVSPSSLPAGTQGAPYSQTVTASGGTGPYAFVLASGSLPTGLTINSGGVISGTPSSSGVFSFTIRATDSLGNVGNGNYTVNIGTVSLVVSPASLPNGTNGTPYSQTVSASGGTGSYTFALASGSLPVGLTISAGGVISGAPTASGSSTFTIRATDTADNIGTSSSYTVIIGTNTLTVNPSSLPPGTQNVAYSQTVRATGGTGPYTFTISSGVLPAGLTLSGAGVISGAPTGRGLSSFTVRALDSLGNTGTRAYSVNIGTVSLTVNPASLPDAVSGKRYSQTIVASGGTAPYTYSIIAGALPPGLTLNAATGVISGTPTGLGVKSFTVQARDVNGNIGSRAYALDPRPDPALDQEVQGLIAAQVATAQRFALAQVTNVTRHLEGLHGQFNPCSFNFGITPPIEQTAAQPYGAPVYANPNQLYSLYGQYGAPVTGAPTPYGVPAAPVARRFPGAADCATDWMSSAAFWTAGSFQFGSMTPTGLSSNNRFNTAGLTAGVDLRMTDQLIIGASLGYGADRSDVGQNGSRSDASSLNASLYASLKLFEPLFLDGAIGYGTLGYDNRRWVSGDSTIVSGRRNGSYWFGALAASLELRRGQLKFAPYARTDFVSASFDGYSEQGSSAQLLTYDTMKVNAVSGAVGLRGSYDIPVSFGTLTPMARVEYRQTSQGAYNQPMYYSDLGAALGSTLSQPSSSNRITTGAVGLRAATPGGMTAELEYGVSGGTGSLIAQTIRAALRLPF